MNRRAHVPEPEFEVLRYGNLTDIPGEAVDLWTGKRIRLVAMRGAPIVRCERCGALYEKSSIDVHGRCANAKCPNR